MTTGPRVTRRISRRPARTSDHWWTLNSVIAASNSPSAKGRCSARASIARASWDGRCARIDTEGSMAVTVRAALSYDPAPAPMLRTVRDSPRASAMNRAIRSSGRR